MFPPYPNFRLSDRSITIDDVLIDMRDNRRFCALNERQDDDGRSARTGDDRGVVLFVAPDGPGAAAQTLGNAARRIPVTPADVPIGHASTLAVLYGRAEIAGGYACSHLIWDLNRISEWPLPPGVRVNQRRVIWPTVLVVVVACVGPAADAMRNVCAAAAVRTGVEPWGKWDTAYRLKIPTRPMPLALPAPRAAVADRFLVAA